MNPFALGLSAEQARRAATLFFVTLASACVSAPEGRAPSPAPASSSGNRVIYPSQTETPSGPVRQPSARRDQTAPAGLVSDLYQLWLNFPGKTGIAVKKIDGDWETAQRANDLFPQQSVSKLWVALTILDMVDKGEVRLDERLSVGYQDLAVFHSPLRDRVVARGTQEESVRDLLNDAITGSDNTANDRLLWRAGGPVAVRDFLKEKGLDGIRFGPGERLMQSGIAGLTWKQEYSVGNRFFEARAALPYSTRKEAIERYLADPVDGATPLAIARALDKLARGELLSPQSTRFILDTMDRVKSGPQRLKGGVPSGWSIGHKTGTGQVLSGMGTGYNDVGILTAPDGTRYAVVVLLAHTDASIPQRMNLMQSVTSAVVRHHGR